jgi:hypothetical protein
VEIGEQFLGGFAGGFLAKGGTIGYGLYATTNRLIVVNVVKVGASSFLGGPMAGFVKGQLMPTLSADESARVIAELDEKKELDIRKDQISRIELKSPGLFGFGHIIITAMPRQETKISLRHKVAFERLRDLMQAFYPAVLTLA